MSQRGGAVSTHLRLSDEVIYSDLIPLHGADLILSMEPMEALRYVQFLKANGKIVTAAEPVKNIPEYPEEKVMEVLSKFQTTIIDTVKIAKEAGSIRSQNLVLLGSAAELLPFEASDLELPIRKRFESKGEKMVEMNLEAFKNGQKAGVRI